MPSIRRLADYFLAPTALEKNSFALDICAPAQKEIAQFGRIVIATECWIEAEKNVAPRCKVPLLQIAQEKIPFRWAPELFRRIVQIKIDRERGDPIEFLAKIRQRFECFDPPHDARHVENIEQLSVKRHLVYVETQDGVTKLFQDEQKESAAAAKIEHALGRGAMKF